MQIYGHRGARGEAPENTLAGFRHAIDVGIRHLELDLQLSADQQVVVIHDGSTRRTMSARGHVRAMTAQELATLRHREGYGTWAFSTGVPTLDAVIQTCPEVEHFQFEVKSRYIGPSRSFCAKLIHVLEQHGLGRRATITSKDRSVLRACRELAPGISRGYVAATRFPYPVHAASDLDCEYLVVDQQFVDRRMVRRANKRNMHISVWTVNDLQQVTRMRRLQVDSIITDYPSAVLAHIAQLRRVEPMPEKLKPIAIAPLVAPHPSL